MKIVNQMLLTFIIIVNLFSTRIQDWSGVLNIPKSERIFFA